MPSSSRPDDLVRLLRAGDAARPRLVWHAPGERIELSGRVLATWAGKVADFLQEEADAGVGTQVRLDGRPHWRFLVWALGVWHIGATVVTMDPDMAVTAGPVRVGSAAAEVVVAMSRRLVDGEVSTAGAATVVALSPESLARASSVPLPPGVVDEASTLLGFADETDPYDRAGGDDAALVGRTVHRYSDLLTEASPDRLHVSGGAPLEEVLTTTASAWAAGGSVVLTDPAWEADHGGNPDSPAFADVLTQEGVSAPRG